MADTAATTGFFNRIMCRDVVEGSCSVLDHGGCDNHTDDTEASKMLLTLPYKYPGFATILFPAGDWWTSVSYLLVYCTCKRYCFEN